MNSRNQAACAWAGLVGVVLILVALVVAGYFVPPRASATPDEIAEFYRTGTFNIRLGLAVWDQLFFTPGKFQPSPGKSAEWNRGRISSKA